jgi:hypothetical protein
MPDQVADFLQPDIMGAEKGHKRVPDIHGAGTRGRAQPGIMVVRWRAEGVELGLLPQEDST